MTPEPQVDRCPQEDEVFTQDIKAEFLSSFCPTVCLCGCFPLKIKFTV